MLRWVRFPHASANKNCGLRIADLRIRIINPQSEIRNMKEWIALNMTPGIGPRAAAKLLERFGSAEAVFGATRTELETLRLRPEAIESIRSREFFEKAVEEIARARTMGVDILLLD